jgi:hypothetical protein
MMLTIAILVLVSSIFAFFADEFGRMFKKIYAVPGVKLLLPLLVASWLILFYEAFGLWLLLRTQKALYELTHLVAAVLPFESNALIFTHVLFLSCLGILPVLFFRWKARRKTSYLATPKTYWLGLILWIIAAILLTVSL